MSINANEIFTEDGKLNWFNNVVQLALQMYVEEDCDSLTLNDEQEMLLRAQGLATANKYRMELRAKAMVVYGD
ncbi:hypothetical protein BI037_gp09 [Morganella phage vB_MmoP_MP2]|uniref:Uncharacterized protein n=1 Tax=Morganella phage vB_MmoP_MP2 TaxID=1852627 RepID=A0A192YA22_9CAUD|nr:hypothetical protein BI037_gp09 [Morganella phage vB_MmoP_MP2]ANM46378.1 hypothetical protein MP2_gp09 [Morganella phage vB_MmoP_MP2]